MTTWSHALLRRTAVLAAVAGLAVANAPVAGADTGSPAIPLPALDVAVVTEALDAAAAALPAAPELPELAEVAEAVAAPAAPAEPTTAPEAATAPVQPPTAAAAAPLPQAAPAAAESAAPAAQPPAFPEPDPMPAPVVEQAQPVNLNVSVRVDSPGDDGAVTQSNSASAAALPGPAPDAPETRYQEPETQYQPAPEATTEAVAAPEETWDWNWSWDCGTEAPEIALPGGTAPQNWEWNWNWNCGGEEAAPDNSDAQLPAQYQPRVAQYQPVNINISIRFNSPGANGPVVQTNVAVAVLAAAVAAPLAALPAAIAPAAPPPGEAPAAEAPAAVPEAPVESLLGLAAWAGVPLSRSAGHCEAGYSNVGRLPQALAGQLRCLVGAGPDGPARVPLRQVLPDWQEELVTQTAAAARTGAGGSTPVRARIHFTGRLVETLAAPRPALAAAARARSQERRRPESLPVDLTREQVLALGYAGVGPAGAADHRIFVVFLFLGAFVFAFADAARLVRDERRAAAAEPGRRRERPG